MSNFSTPEANLRGTSITLNYPPGTDTPNYLYLIDTCLQWYQDYQQPDYILDPNANNPYAFELLNTISETTDYISGDETKN